MGQIIERFVDSTDGVRVAVYEEGNPDGPTVVLVHGWPDSHVLWDGVAPLLTDRFRVIRYDNRGAGKTSVPKAVSAYSMAGYADDFGAVLDAVAPGQPVHVLAHDWGSTGIWEYLSRPAASDRVASFTSVSGPSGDHMNRFIIGGLKRPYRPRRFLQALDQLLRFSYMGFFSIPVLAPLVVRTFLAGGLRRMLMIRDGIPADRLYHSDTYRFDAANSLKVYRANYFKTIRTARTHHYVEVPVQVIVSSSDPHVRPHVYEEIRNWVPRLWRRDIKAGHWVPMSHPQVLANSVAEFIDFLGGKPASRALLRA
ncbi:MAG TPA: alpha/beta fold hydrolase, partial [Mycobacterium sp.]|nr:alpha/beta fold hydrolase [Mycobacterium sp.]